MNQYNIVLDCNIMIAGALGSNNALNVIERSITNHKVFISDAVINDYKSVTDHKKMKPVTGRYNALIALIQEKSTAMVINELHPMRHNIANPNTKMYFDLCHNIGDTVYITANESFDKHKYETTFVINPNQFLGMMNA